MAIKCIYPNPQSAANHVLDEVKALHALEQRLTARPFNRYDPTYTMWWLVASTEWPAYPFAKIFFDPRRDYRFIHCGIHLEKGIGRSVASAYPKAKSWIMRDDWAWHRLSSDVRRGVVDQAVQGVATASGEPVKVIVDASYLQDPGSFDPYATREDRSATTDTIEFASRAGELTMTSTRFGVNVLSQPARATNLAEMVEALEKVKQVDWLWYDLYLCTVLEAGQLAPETARDLGAWDAGDIWERCLLPWKQWIA